MYTIDRVKRITPLELPPVAQAYARAIRPCRGNRSQASLSIVVIIVVVIIVVVVIVVIVVVAAIVIIVVAAV